MERSKADSFTAFLLEKQRLKAMDEASQQSGATPLTLLSTLAAVWSRDSLNRKTSTRTTKNQ